jgi:cyanophycin synthetase
MGVAGLAADLALGNAIDLDARLDELDRRLAEPAPADDRPGWLRDAERQVPIVAVTGTNGKTTTTRLCSHILRLSGRRVGWTTTSGVVIEGEEVLAGDYTGPQGAHRVLSTPGLDVAVLETARGGILLRGLAYESNDVGVFLNVSNDHLGLLGVQTLETLAQTKATVVRVTRPEGYAVLNADDPLVRGVAGGLRARILYFSRSDDNPTLTNHVAAGGAALHVQDGRFVLSGEGKSADLVALDEIPMTLGGRAPHMTENALAAAAAGIGFGLEPIEVAAGLRTFRNTPEQNAGRLNVFDLDGLTVIVDYAHNESGLEHLLRLGRALAHDGSRLIAVVGTAGDRGDDALRAIGRTAGTLADGVVIKETQRYLRGRSSATEMSRLMEDGVRTAGNASCRVEASELAGVEVALEESRAGDVVAVMCIEQLAEVLALLTARGRLVS